MSIAPMRDLSTPRPSIQARTIDRGEKEPTARPTSEVSIYSNGRFVGYEVLNLNSKSALKTEQSKDVDSTPLQAKFKYKNFGSGDARLDEGFLGFTLPHQRWERIDVKQVELEVASKEERVKLSVKEGVSSYQADRMYLFNVGDKAFTSNPYDRTQRSKARFLFAEQSEGWQGLEKIEISFLKTSLINISGFALHSETQNSYQSTSSSKGDFAAPMNRDVGVGATLSVGPMSVTSKFKRSERTIDPEAPWQKSQDLTFSLNLDDAWDRLGTAKTATVRNVLPSVIFAGTFDSTSIFRTASEGPSDTTKGFHAGAQWGWKGGRADISCYKYALDSHRTGYENYDSAGQGVTASLNGWKDNLYLNSSFSFTQSDNLAPYQTNRTRSVNLYASSTIKFDETPDLFFEFLGSRYGYSDVTYDTKFEQTSWSSAFGLDLSKYFMALPNPKGPPAPSEINLRTATVKAMYRFQNGLDFLAPNHINRQGHFVGLSLRASLY